MASTPQATTVPVLPIFPIVVGTAGHVDHGKSSLVKALTGIDPDRLKEEKERGLTIDIGFANFVHRNQFRVGIVDVPGHERFIKNMVTGATGVDLVVLVVAANDGVMQQTREHLEILTLLGKQHGLVALTKIDLVDPDSVELAKLDIEETVRGTFLEGKPICPFSVYTGAGFDEFRATLADAIDATPMHADTGAFRMLVQRVFAVKGQGAVLTGIPLSGKVLVGDEVETQPSSQRGKVRHVQAYHGDRDRAQAGHSTALNISGVEHGKVERGHVVATPGYGKPVTSLAAEIQVVGKLKRPLKYGMETKLLIDNSEVVAKLILLNVTEQRPQKRAESGELEVISEAGIPTHGGPRRLYPGEKAIVKFQLAGPVVAAAGDRFILRLPSPSITLAGGRVVSVTVDTLRPKDSARVDLLVRKSKVLDDPDSLLGLTLLEAGPGGLSGEDLARATWALPQEIATRIDKLLKQGVMRRLSIGVLVHKDAWAAAGASVLALVEDFHKKNPQAPGMPDAVLQRECGLDARVLGEVLAELAKAGKVQRAGEVVIHAKYGAKLSPAQQAALESMRKAMEAAKFSPPSLEELQALTKLAPVDFRACTDYLTKRGEAALVGGTFLMGPAAVEEAIARARAFIDKSGPMKAADFKTALDTSRKYAIPILEYLDAKGVFINKDGVRTMKR